MARRATVVRMRLPDTGVPVRHAGLLPGLIALLCIVGSSLVGGRAVLAADRPESAIVMDAQPLLDGNARAGEWIAIRVHLENPGPAVRGELRVTTSDRQTSSYGTAVELPTGARQDHVIHTRLGPFGSRMTVSLVSDGTTLASVRATTRNVPDGTWGIYVVAEYPERLVGDLRASRDVRRGTTDVVDISTADLPPRVEAWSAVDRLVWQDAPFGALDAQQLDALVTWVALGGDLTIVGGSTGAAALEALPADLLPFVPERTVDVAAADLAAILGGIPVTAAPLPTLAGRLVRGTELAGTGELTVAARAQHGQGSVTLVGFDPSVSWLSGTSTGATLWTRIVPPIDAAADAPPSALLSANIVLDALNFLPAVDAPRMDQLLLLFLGYLILLGPVNYLVLRRLDRREWAWFTMPGLAVVFAVGALALGTVLRGTNVVVNELGVVRGAAGSDRGVADVYVGVFSPTRATFDVDLAGGVFVSQPIREWEERERSPIDVLLGDPARVRGLQVGYGDLRGLRVQTAVQTPRFETSLRLVEGRVQGTVTNASDMAVQHVALVQGGGMQLLGDMRPGDGREVDVASARSGSTSFGSLSRLAGSTDETSAEQNRTLVTRLAIIRALSGEWWWDDGSVPDPLRALGPVIVAWRSGGTLDISVGGPTTRTGETLYLLPVQVSVSGPVVFQGSTYRHSVLETRSVEAWDDPRGTLYLSRGTMTVEYRPVRFEATLDPTDLVFRLDDRGSPPSAEVVGTLAPLPAAEQPDQDDPVGTTRDDTGAIHIQLLDHEADTWVELGGEIRRGRSYRVAEAARFVDPAGGVRVRFVNRASTSREFGLGIRVEGVVP